MCPDQIYSYIFLHRHIYQICHAKGQILPQTTGHQRGWGCCLKQSICRNSPVCGVLKENEMKNKYLDISVIQIFWKMFLLWFPQILSREAGILENLHFFFKVEQSIIFRETKIHFDA